MKPIVKIGAAVLTVGLLIQLVRFDHTNPPVVAPIQVPDNVSVILKNSCFDCHSNETEWPWYSNIAPVSWLVYRDVVEGREELNFSNWGALPSDEQQEMADEIIEAVEEGEMPMAIYTVMHPDAKLSPDQMNTLKNWARTIANSSNYQSPENRQDPDDD